MEDTLPTRAYAKRIKSVRSLTDTEFALRKQKIENYLKIFVWGAVILAVLGFSLDLYTKWGITILISLILSVVAGEIISSFGGDFLKKITIPIKIYKFKFSVTLFFISVFLVKFFILK